MGKNYGIVLAGGKGNRMNSQVPKQYMTIHHRPVLFYSLMAMEESPYIDEVIIVASKDSVTFCQEEIVKKYNLSKVTLVVEGGAERWESVYNGLLHTDGEGFVYIHDGARPGITPILLERLYNEVQIHHAVVAAVPSKDTVKITDGSGIAVSTPDRSLVWNIQTPQVFRTLDIKRAYSLLMEDKNPPTVTDDSMVAEYYLDAKIRLVMGDYGNLKITTNEDFLMVKNILKKSDKKM